jgi:hypothetical protein
MRKITKDTTEAFYNRKLLTISNTKAEYGRLYLHGNLIAELDSKGNLFINACGWLTNTTKERLNGLKGVSIVQRKGAWFLNGSAWNGGSTKITN